jgi:serine protease Do
VKHAWLLCVVPVLAVSLIGGCGPERSGPQIYVALEDARKAARDHVYPATVRIDARRSEFVGGERRRLGGTGSGVIFDEQGHVLTNYHVAGRADELTCILYSKERVRAKLIGGDPWTDLAIVQLDLDEVKRKGGTFSPATFGDSDKVEEGDSVLAVGSPFGMSRSISNGIISCHDRILGTGLELTGGLETGLFNTWLQTDAAINPGNSGGPLVDFRGEVIGINTRSGGGNDLGFAVPINVAKEVIRQILQNGKVTRSTIGASFQPLQDLEAFFDVGKSEGAVIAGVEAEGPAAKAGIQPRDILVEYGGMKVEGRYPEQLFALRKRVADTPVGAKVPVKVRRSGEVLAMEIATEELTTVRSTEQEFPRWGVVGQNITERLASRENLPNTKGVYVTGVRRGEAAERANLEKGDVIFRVGDRDIAGLQELSKCYQEAMARKQAMVLVRVRRGQAVVPVVLRVDFEEVKKPAPAAPATTKPAAPKTPAAPPAVPKAEG